MHDTALKRFEGPTLAEIAAARGKHAVDRMVTFDNGLCAGATPGRPLRKGAAANKEST